MKNVKLIVIVAVTSALLLFIVVVMKNASTRKGAFRVPELNEKVLMFYGRIDPVGKGVSVAPAVNGVVDALYIKEKAHVREGEALCRLKIPSREGEFTLYSLNAPRDGIIYKCEIRKGESFGFADRDRIIVGAPDLQVTGELEPYWIGLIDKKKTYHVYNAENDRFMGTATYKSASRYLRPKAVRAESPGEMLSGEYQEIVFNLMTSEQDLPIGLQVYVRLESPEKTAPNVVERRH